MALKHADSAPTLAVDAGSSWPGGPGGWDRSDLMRRIWFTLGALIVFRIGTFIPIPGLSPEAVAILWGDIVHAFPVGPPWSLSSDALRITNAFSGGGVERMAIFALGVMPYLSALMIMHLAGVVWPAIGGWKSEGDSGRRKLRRYSCYGTLVLAAIQGYAVALALENPANLPEDLALALSAGRLLTGLPALDPDFIFRVQTAITIAGGTMFLVWLGEQITVRGVGNGIALIVFAGLISQIPDALAKTLDFMRMGSLTPWTALFLLIIMAGSAALIVIVAHAQRRIVIQSPQSQASLRASGSQCTQIPLKLNGAGMFPAVFATLLMPIPLTLAGLYEGGGPGWMWSVIRQFHNGQPFYLILYAALIVLFCFLCRPEAYSPANIARDLERTGKFVAGIRPGRATADYLGYVQTRLTSIGAVCLAGVCILPAVLLPWATWIFTMAGTVLAAVVLITLDLLATVHWRYSMGRS